MQQMVAQWQSEQRQNNKQRILLQTFMLFEDVTMHGTLRMTSKLMSVTDDNKI